MSYGEQQRGDRDAYRRYLAGMDASMRQKVALTAAHLVGEGRLADMGSGSGAASHALAALYPALQVVGVDVSETMVEIAKETHRLPNLSFVVGDIAQPVFEPESLDAIFDSSVLHHVTSFNGYEHAAAGRALQAQATQLRRGGVLVVRDFLAPEPSAVLLDLPADDGDPSDDPRTCSTAALFERFATEFRSLADDRGFSYDRVEPPPRSGWRRYRVDHRMAVEFVLRKDYRADWESEVKEEYTYATQRQFEAEVARLGMRVLASIPIRNPWIVRNRIRGKVELCSTDGARLEDPATNYVIVGEKVAAGEGVRFSEGDRRAPAGFLELTHYRHRESGRVLDLVRRPHLTIDTLPWFCNEESDEIFVLARRSYPRPILQCDARDSVPIDGRHPSGYVTEPLVVIQDDKPLGQTVEEALRVQARIEPQRIRSMRSGGTYYPSPGGVQEEVRSLFVAIDPVFVERSLPARSGFSTSGDLRAIEARQLLRCAQVGGLPDARLELNVYQLLAATGRDPGPWIGEAITPAEADFAPTITSCEVLRQRASRRMFERVGSEASTGFLEIGCAEFRELDAAGRVVAAQTLELVLPRPFSFNTIAVAVLCRRDGGVYLGLDDFDLPAAQCFNGNSEILVAPAWRLGRSLRSITPARAWILERLRAEYGVACGEVWELGGAYHPSPGVTPEVVFPLAVEARREHADGERHLTWVPLADVVANLDLLVDGHLRICALRAAHALGIGAAR